MECKSISKTDITNFLEKYRYGHHNTEVEDDDEKYVKYLFEKIVVPTYTLFKTCEGSCRIMESSALDPRAIIYKDKVMCHYSYFVNVKTNEKFYNYDDIKKEYSNFIVNYSSATVVRYIDELDVILICGLDEQNGETIINDNNLYIYMRDKTIYTINRWYKDRKYNIYTTTYANISPDPSNHYVNFEFQEAFKKMYNQAIFNVGANNYVLMNGRNALESFVNYNAKLEIKNGPAQKKINELVAYKLPDVETKFPASVKGELYYETIIQKVKENTAVVRWKINSVYDETSTDGLRIYIEGKKVHACKLNNSNQFVRTTISHIKPENFCSANMHSVDKEALKGTILEYYGEIIDEIPEQYKSLLIILFILNPNIEKLYKAGFKNLIFKSLEEGCMDVEKYIAQKFYIDKKDLVEAKNIYKALKINKYQFNRIKEIEDDFSIIPYLKKCFNLEDIASLDNKTFDDIWEALLEDTKDGYYWNSNYKKENFSNIYKILSEYNDKNLIKIYRSVVLPVLIKQTDRYDARHYYDYIEMVHRMDNDFKNFKLTFKDNQEISEMHDAAQAVYNLKRETYKTKAFQESVKKIEKYEFSAEEFSVIVPKLPGELANEGMELHHCVKSYIDRVCEGRTNIAFIRKTNDLTKPFFTVEISNDGNIEQVHGFANRNADTEPGLPDFVKKWAKERKLKVNGINKVR